MLQARIGIFLQFYFDNFDLLKWQKKLRWQKSENARTSLYHFKERLFTVS